MRVRFILYLVTTLMFLLLLFIGVLSWRFLLGSVARTREIKIDVLQLPDIDMDRYNKIVKKGT